ncbi:hypothetical protein QZH41_009332, partial [Actinostola sp. cb2023]
RNEAGNSPAMVFLGFKKCMDYLIGYGLRITTFISDRHVVIVSHMRKVLTNIVHYFDIWHLKKSSSVHNKMCDALTHPNLIKGIKQASPLAQTSCLEGFHSVVNQSSPKMIGYSFVLLYIVYVD